MLEGFADVGGAAANGKLLLQSTLKESLGVIPEITSLPARDEAEDASWKHLSELL